MNHVKTGGFGLVAATVALMACASDTTNVAAPEVDVDVLEAQTEGTTYNGWTQSAVGHVGMQFNQWRIDHTFTRSSGDSTRGGGGCYVRKTTTTCSADSTCITAAQQQYGSSAYGYCYASRCYLRPGSNTTYCAVNPNRSSRGKLPDSR